MSNGQPGPSKPIAALFIVKVDAVRKDNTELTSIQLQAELDGTSHLPPLEQNAYRYVIEEKKQAEHAAMCVMAADLLRGTWPDVKCDWLEDEPPQVRVTISG